MLHPARVRFAVAFWLLTPALAPAQTVLVKPYVQPGDGGPLGKSDVKVICWLTDQKPGAFFVEYDLPGGAHARGQAGAGCAGLRQES